MGAAAVYDDSLQLDEAAFAQFLELPSSTHNQIKQILRELRFSEAPRPSEYRSMALWIKNYVSQSAEYDLNTPRMPQDEGDFALWFLEDSDTGYCVHFATAATVMLRAAGVPARYVTGYVTSAGSGETVTVRGSDAHAWVEYYQPGVGWQVLEVTPGIATETGTSVQIPSDTVQITTPTQPVETVQTPEVTVPGGEPDKQDAKPDMAWLPWVWLALLVSAAAVGQWKLRLRLKRKRLRAGNMDQQALAYWREIEILSGLLKAEPEAALRELAQKAKFSQHTLRPEELERLERGREALIARLEERKFPFRLACRLIFAVY